MENIDDGRENLNDFLEEAELQQYCDLFREVLKVTKLSQLKFVVNNDLMHIGLSKPEQRRYKKIYSKYFPNPYLTKLKKLLSSNRKNDQGHSSQSTIELQPFTELNAKVPPKHIISIEDITINKELGMGQFGVVQQGTWTTGNQRLQVAIKCLGHERMTSNSTEFLKEAAVMHSIEHPNIVRLFGVVLHLDSLMLVTELAPLRSLLECLREVSLRPNFPVPNLCEFAEQICSGMTYLEMKRLIHRDLAARNILVFSKDRVKISDFGLSRALGVGKDYYQTNYNVNLKLPVAWCAPECILYLRFTSLSDVWAFGVCLWEMFTYGFQPWAAFSGQQILEAIDAPNFQRLERPECCPEEYYNMMLECWSHEPSDRPRFKELGPKLRAIRPEEVQAVANFQKPKDGRRGTLLEYKTNQIITVLGKESMTKTSMWYGVLAGGSCGVFDPNNTKPYNRNDPPRQVVPPYKPSEDLEQVPLINPNSPSHLTGASCTSSYPLLSSRPEMKADCDEVDLPCAETKMKSLKRLNHKTITEPTTSKSILNKVKNATLGRSHKTDEGQGASSKTDEVHEYHEISDTDTESVAMENTKIDFLQLPESPGTPKGCTDFSQSLLDEMESMFRNLDTKRSEPGPSNAEGSSSRAQTLSKNDKKKISHTGTMKLMSAHDEKTLNTAVAMANEITTKSMTDLDGDSKQPKSPNDKSKFHFKFPQLSLHHNTPNEMDRDAAAKQERRNFSDKAHRVADIQATITEESKAAYMCLIDEPTPTTSLITHLPKEATGRHKPATMPKPTRSTTDPRPQFNSLQKQPNKTRIRPLSTSDAESQKKTEVINELPLPPRTTKPMLVDKRRHIRKYPLRIPSDVREPQAGPSSKQIIYQNAFTPVVCQVQIEYNRRSNGDDVCDGAEGNATNPFSQPGSSTANPFNPYMEPVECGLYNVRRDDSDDDDDEDGDVQYIIEGTLVKDCTDHVSVEDLLEFADQKPCGRQRGVESDEVRIMRKVLKEDVSPEECLEALELCDWDVHFAIKLIRIKNSVGNITLEDCSTELCKANGDVNKACAVLTICNRNN